MSEDETSTPASAQKTSWAKRLLIAALGLIVLVSVTGFYLYSAEKERFFAQPGPLPDQKSILIERGLSGDAIAEKLANAQVIDDPMRFRLGARFFGDKQPIKAGEFNIPAGATMAEVLTVLQTASPVQYRVLIREGITVAQALQIIAEEEKLYGEISGTYEEGSLLPDTYFFVRGESRDMLLGRMKVALDDALNAAWEARVPQDYLTSPADLLTLASIIEKETSRDKEKPLVSKVFHNRLAQGMKLQSDPTVIYGIKKDGPLGRSLKRAEVRSATPYNTYTIDALPPGPIALPSRASLMAAAQPGETDALFFVVDGRGGHVFAKTYKEHLRNIRNWRKTVRERRAERAAKEKQG